MNEHQIDRYLLDLMSPTERSAFEAQLESDDVLAQQVKKQRETIKDIEGIGRLELKSKLKSIHENLYQKQGKSNTRFRRLFYRAATAAAIIGVLSIGWWSMQRTPGNDQLFTQNFEPYELSLTERSSNDNTLAQIEELYDKGQYTEVIPLLETATNDAGLNSSQIILGLGISYLQTDQPQKAITQFESILSNNDFNFEDEAQWYLSLTYLKMKQNDKAMAHLNELASDSTRDHHQAAQSLLSQLKKK